MKGIVLAGGKGTRLYPFIIEALRKFTNDFNSWRLLALSILLITLIARFVASTSDRLNPDDYYLMYGVEKSFSEYIEIQKSGAYFPNFYPIIIHYWLSNRIFGNELAGYRIMSLIASLIIVLGVYYALLKHWNSTASICFFSLFILTFNKQLQFFAGYSMFLYANSLLVSCFLFFLFLKLSKEKLSTKLWLLVTFITIPVAFFTHPIIVVPVATGVFSVIVFRLWQYPSSRNLKFVWQSLWEMKPLLVFPLMHLIIWNLFPFESLENIRDIWYLKPFLFLKSQYTKDFTGVLHFITYNTANLFSTLLLPDGISKTVMKGSVLITLASTAIMVFMGVIAIISLAIQLKRRQLDHGILFALLFVVVNLLFMLVGGFIGYYPFGFSRYSYWLLFPLVIIIAHSIYFVFDPILLRMNIKSTQRTIPVILSIIIILGGSYINIQKYTSNMKMRRQNNSVLETVRNYNADLVLFSHTFDSVLRAKDLNQYIKGYNIGMEKTDGMKIQNKETDIPKEVFELIKGDNPSKPIKEILIVFSNQNVFLDLYPTLSELINTKFTQVDNITSPLIWAGYYEKKEYK